METRKWILLSLPISVAFIIGGFSGEMLGKHEFYWPAAILWATVIGIIDYNFSIIKEMGRLAVVGRIVLVLSSAAITATVGDHIIFKDTIKELKRQKDKNTEAEDDSNPVIVRLKAKVDDAQTRLAHWNGEKQRLNSEVTYEINNGGCYAKCEEKKVLLEDARTEVADAKVFLAEAKAELDKVLESKAEDREAAKTGNDIITEIQDLYGYIFDVKQRGYGGAIMFTIFVLMVICIETLPLILKSGITYAQVAEREANEQRIIDDAKRKAEQDKIAKIRRTEQLILRNNR